MTTRILSNALLALVWVFLTENYSILNLLVGMGLGFVAIVLSNRIRDAVGYLNDLVNCIRLLGLFLYRVLQANLVLARDIVFRPNGFQHAFLAIDVSALSRGKKVILGYMISLTPGTLVLDYADDDKTLYIHSLYGNDNEKVGRQIDSFARYLIAINSQDSGRKKT